MSATAVAGGLLRAGQASVANRTNGPTIGYFERPERPPANRFDRPWEMTEDDRTEIVGRVRSGRTLKPERWPEQSQFAVALSFDCDHEVGSVAGGNFAPGRLSWDERGRRVGMPRIG